MACSLLPVSYPACSISSFGDFNVGDCLITLSSTALTISLPDNYPLATWHYRTIRAFSCTSTIFSFTSGRRGPFGAHEYEFNVNPLEMSSLLSVLSATTGMKIERDVTTGNGTTQLENSMIAENISLSSNCYKVANSTFYTDVPSDCYSYNGPRKALNLHHATSSPEISIPRSYGNMQGGCVGPLAVLEFQPKPLNMMQHSAHSVDMLVVHPQEKNEMDFRNTDACHYVQSLPATGTYLLALPTNGQEPANEYLQLQQSANPLQSMDKEGSSPPLLPDHHNPITPFPTNGHDAVATAGAKSVDRDSNCGRGFVSSVSTFSGTDTVDSLSSSPTTLSGCDVSNGTISLKKGDQMVGSRYQNCAPLCNTFRRKGLNDDELYEIGIVRHVTRPGSSENYSDVCVGVQVATGIIL